MVQFVLELFKVNAHHHILGTEGHAHLPYQFNALLDILMMDLNVFNKVKLDVLRELGMDLFVWLLVLVLAHLVLNGMEQLVLHILM